MNDCITTTKQSTTKPCAYFLGYTLWAIDVDLMTKNLVNIGVGNVFLPDGTKSLLEPMLAYL